MEAKKEQAAGNGVIFEENRADVAGNTVEGTGQCLSCQRHLRLGDASFCFRWPGVFRAAAEITGWVAGQCDHYLKI